MAVTREQLEDAGLVAIVRADIAADWPALAQALAEGGVRAMEITLNTPDALAGIAQIRSALGASIAVGAGTVLDANDARRAFDAGAEFLVTPTLQLDTIALCQKRGAPIACGCLTPTEALAAHRAGADFVKLFPADTLGPAYVRALLAPLPFLRLVPTGGVTVENIADYFYAGAAGVAVGSSLVSRQILHEQNWPELTRRARMFVQAVAEARAAREKK